MESFSQEKDSCVFVFFDGKELINLYYSSVPSFETIYFRYQFNRAKSNSIDIFQELLGQTCQSVNLSTDDRYIVFKFKDYSIVSTFYTGKPNNCFVVDNNEIVVNSLNNKPEFINQKLVFDKHESMNFNSFESNTLVWQALARCNNKFGKIYANYICNELQINSNLKLRDLNNNDIANIDFYQEKLKGLLLNSENQFLYEIEDRFELSLIKLNPEFNIIQEFNDINYASHKTFVKNLVDRRFDKLFKQLSHILSKEANKLRKKIEHFKNEQLIFDRAEKYKLWADILISQPNIKIKCGEKGLFHDWNGNEHEIKLDEKLNLLQNANVFFERSKGAIRELEAREKRLPIMEKELQNIENNILELNSLKYIDDLNKFTGKLNKYMRFKMQNKDDIQQSDKFRVFDLGEGFTLYVGKNAANNDELTMKFAKPNDLWLHARGTSGSHAVIKLSSATKPPKNILLKASEICAYYSGARNAKYVPVCYTFKKFVRKPKGANVGAVVISKEEIIMAEPRIPEGSVE